MPSLLIGYSAWYTLLAPDMGLNDVLELVNSFSYSGASSSRVVEHIGSASSSGLVDGKGAAEVLQSIAEEETSSNDEADGAAERIKI